jgi:hypothetical protein
MINMMIGKKYGKHLVIFDIYVKSPAFFCFSSKTLRFGALKNSGKMRSEHTF